MCTFVISCFLHKCSICSWYAYVHTFQDYCYIGCCILLMILLHSLKPKCYFLWVFFLKNIVLLIQGLIYICMFVITSFITSSVFSFYASYLSVIICRQDILLHLCVLVALCWLLFSWSSSWTHLSWVLLYVDKARWFTPWCVIFSPCWHLCPCSSRWDVCPWLASFTQFKCHFM